MGNTQAFFVYGTLSDMHHFHVLTGQYLARKQAVLYNYEKVQRSSSFPYIIPSEGKKVYGYYIEGVDEEGLRILDRYENEGGLYIREEVEVEVNGEKKSCFVYVGNPVRLDIQIARDLEAEDRIEEHIESEISRFIRLDGVGDDEFKELEKRTKMELLGMNIQEVLHDHFQQPKLFSFLVRHNIEKNKLPDLEWIKSDPGVEAYADAYLWLIVKQTIFNQIEKRVRDAFRGSVRIQDPFYDRTISCVTAFVLLNTKLGPLRQMATSLGLDRYQSQLEYTDYVTGALFLADRLYNHNLAKNALAFIKARRHPGGTPLGVEIELSNIGAKCIDASPGLDPVFDSFYYFHDFDLGHRLWKVGGHVDDHQFSGRDQHKTRGFLEMAFGKFKVAADLSKPVTNDPWLLSVLISAAAKFYGVKPHSVHISIQVEKGRPFTTPNLHHLLLLLLLGGDLARDETGVLREMRLFRGETVNRYGQVCFARINHHKQSEEDQSPSPLVEFQFPRLYLEHNYEPLILALKGYQLASNPHPLDTRDTSPNLEVHRSIEKQMLDWAENPSSLSDDMIEDFLQEVSKGLNYECEMYGGHEAEYIESSLRKIKESLLYHNGIIREYEASG